MQVYGPTPPIRRNEPNARCLQTCGERATTWAMACDSVVTGSSTQVCVLFRRLAITHPVARRPASLPLSLCRHRLSVSQRSNTTDGARCTWSSWHCNEKIPSPLRLGRIHKPSNLHLSGMGRIWLNIVHQLKLQFYKREYIDPKWGLPSFFFVQSNPYPSHSTGFQFSKASITALPQS